MTRRRFFETDKAAFWALEGAGARLSSCSRIRPTRNGCVAISTAILEAR